VPFDPSGADTENGRVIVVVGILAAVFVVPEPWGIPVVIGAVALEIAETLFWMRVTGRHPPKVGPETLIGATGRVVQACRPVGTVRVRGETWQARCDAGADAHDQVRVVEREGLTLVVERT
jgi:membrane-bound serine protease (ClpP class)